MTDTGKRPGKTKPTIRGLIFDFDGLIIDSETPVFRAWKELYKRHGHTLHKEDWVDIIGVSPEDHDPIQDLGQIAGQDFNQAKAKKQVERWEMAFVNDQEALPGVEETIAAAKLADLKLGIASSSSHRWVEHHLRRLGLREFFQAIACSDDVEQSKPDPRVYELVLQKLGLEAQNAIVLEDSPNGMIAAKRAGLFCVVIPNGMTESLSFDKDGYQPDLVIDTLLDLPLEDFLS